EGGGGLCRRVARPLLAWGLRRGPRRRRGLRLRRLGAVDRAVRAVGGGLDRERGAEEGVAADAVMAGLAGPVRRQAPDGADALQQLAADLLPAPGDRKSTRLNSS